MKNDTLSHNLVIGSDVTEMAAPKLSAGYTNIGACLERLSLLVIVILALAGKVIAVPYDSSTNLKQRPRISIYIIHRVDSPQ